MAFIISGSFGRNSLLPRTVERVRTSLGTRLSIIIKAHLVGLFAVTACRYRYRSILAVWKPPTATMIIKNKQKVLRSKNCHSPCENLFARVHAFFFIRTSKFWPSLIVLKFLHILSLNCS